MSGCPTSNIAMTGMSRIASCSRSTTNWSSCSLQAERQQINDLYRRGELKDEARRRIERETRFAGGAPQQCARHCRVTLASRRGARGPPARRHNARADRLTRGGDASPRRRAGGAGKDAQSCYSLFLRASCAQTPLPGPYFGESSPHVTPARRRRLRGLPRRIVALLGASRRFSRACRVALVQIGSTCLHSSYAHVHGDMSVSHEGISLAHTNNARLHREMYGMSQPMRTLHGGRSRVHEDSSVV